MNKKIEYNGYAFNVMVVLNTSVERRPNGVRKHTLTINDLGISNFYKKEEVAESELMSKIEEFTQLAKDFVDGREKPKSEIEQKLYDLGFK